VRERDAAALQHRDRQRDVGAAQIDAALRSEAGRVVRLLKQQAHAGAVEERQVAEPVELPQPDHVLIERLGAIDIDDGERDLADVTEIEEHGGTSLCASLPS
jgi:hypothetical protein